MQLFLLLLAKLIPLYAIIVLGFIAGKILKVQKENIAVLLIYVIAPVVIFHGAVTTKISWSALSLPVLFFLLCCGLCGIFYVIASVFWTDANRNIVAFAAGTGNTGYFGIPVALAIFDEQILSLVVLCILGFVLYENSVGFFTVAKGHHTLRESLQKVARLPTLYAFALGLLVNVSHVPLGQIYSDVVLSFRGAYTVLGMMMIGLGLSSLKHFRIDLQFVGLTFFAKFLVWPAIVYALVVADTVYFGFYDSSVHNVMILMSIVPLAANSVAFAAELRAEPEKTATAVLLSTLFALFYIPLIVIFFLS